MHAADEGNGVSRRKVVRAGALGVGVAWVTPVIAMVSMQSASAASGPPDRVWPPRGPGNNNGNGNTNPGGGKPGGRG